MPKNIDPAGTSSVEHAEIKELKTENTRQRDDVAILSAATAFFAGPSIPAPAAHGESEPRAAGDSSPPPMLRRLEELSSAYLRHTSALLDKD